MTSIKLTLGKKETTLTSEDVKNTAITAGRFSLKILKKGVAKLGQGLNKATEAMSNLDADSQKS